MEEGEVLKPRNTMELFRWLIFEPQLLNDYSESVKGWRPRLQALVPVMPWIALISVSVYVITGIILSVFDLPIHLTKDEIVDLQGSFIDNFNQYLSETIIKFLSLLALGLAFGLAFGLAGGLAFGLAFGLAGGLALGLAFGLSWTIFYYHLPTYCWYTIKSLLGKYNLYDNPHIFDGGIAFPIIGLEEQLCKEAFEDPSIAYGFGSALFERYRDFQYRLAYQVLIAGTAGFWKKERLKASTLKEHFFYTLEYANREVKEDWMFFKTTRIERRFEPPSSDWYTQIETTRLSLSAFEQESNVWLRVRYFKEFQDELDRLYKLTLQQPPEWNDYFVKALSLWQSSAEDKLKDLELEAAAEEPIEPNIYVGGEKLKPVNREQFLGRLELRDAFKKRVVTAQQMPLFFIQGQRRVGKSSLIAFLPSILDSGFRVLSIDMQEYPGLPFPVLLQKIRERLYEQLFHQEAPPVEMSEIWLDCWHNFRQELDDIAQNQEAKIVLAIDEYEELHRILQTDPEQGARVLGAMRSWSQSQNRVVFLFAGADFLSELRQPNWGEYFVQAERLVVDYLGREDTLKLITLVDLKYPPELLERMWQETQGHPCLLQKICREIVTIVNKTGRTSRAVTEADYDAALQTALLYPDDGVVNIFWNQFCQNRGLKNAVRQILRGEMPEESQALLVLEDHKFIVREGSGVRMRVPLFELWLRRYEVT